MRAPPEPEGGGSLTTESRGRWVPASDDDRFDRSCTGTCVDDTGGGVSFMSWTRGARVVGGARTRGAATVASEPSTVSVTRAARIARAEGNRSAGDFASALRHTASRLASTFGASDDGRGGGVRRFRPRRLDQPGKLRQRILHAGGWRPRHAQTLLELLKIDVDGRS